MGDKINACESVKLDRLPDYRMDIHMVTQNSGAVGYYMDVDLYTSEGTPAHQLSFMTGETGINATDPHFAREWRVKNKDQTDCCDKEGLCFVSLPKPSNDHVVQKRQEFIEEHATKFNKLRGQAKFTTVGQLNAKIGGKCGKYGFMTMWIYNAPVSGRTPINKDNVLVEYLTDKQSGIRYVAYYRDASDKGKNNPVLFAAFSKQGELLLFMENKNLQGQNPPTSSLRNG